MIGASRAFCMVPSEWYPLPPSCKCKREREREKQSIVVVFFSISNVFRR